MTPAPELGAGHFPWKRLGQVRQGEYFAGREISWYKLHAPKDKSQVRTRHLTWPRAVHTHSQQGSSQELSQRPSWGNDGPPTLSR